ncbi:MAG TPA: hypothetical protein VML19_33365 [Verrucomicrobiae bacterium]|nr:hypothetical protein [Verrucomicrobiae bacterium]
MQRVFAIAALMALAAFGAFAQQERGDKEIGIGGQLYFQGSNGTSNGNLSAQFSFGVFASSKNYFGFEADPTLSITGQSCTVKTPCVSLDTKNAIQESTNGNTHSTNLGGFFGGNYRHMLGSNQGKIFFFVGAGGGLFVLGGGGSTLNSGSVFPEFGLKSYISQKTSLEFSYKLLYELNGSGSGSFADRINNQVTVSIRHIF